MASAEAQSKLLADYIRGAYRLLDRAAMKHLIRDVQRGMERRYVASKRHTIQVVMRSMSASFARNTAPTTPAAPSKRRISSPLRPSIPKHLLWRPRR